MRWREFSRPITELSEVKPMQSRITFDTQLKIGLLYYVLFIFLFVFVRLRLKEKIFAENMLQFLQFLCFISSWDFALDGPVEQHMHLAKG